MSASARPRLRPDLRFIKQENEGGVAWLVKDPVAMKYFRFGALEAWVMQQLDGEHTLDDVCAALQEELGLRTTPANLDVLVRRLREVGLVERTADERSALLMEQLRQQRRARLRQTESSVLRMRFTFGSPDRFFDWCVAHMPWFWSRNFVLLSMGLFFTYAVLLTVHWSDFVAGLTLLYHPSTLTPAFALTAYAAIATLILVHELGHGLTCKRFGGEVREMGAMLLYFSPAFYCNVNDAWSFEKRSHRLWVTFAGGWIELVSATMAMLVWLLTEPGTLINGVALFVGAFGGGLALLLNYNPLIPLDGYYALVDWLELPNLKARSYEYTSARIRRSLLRLNVQLPAVTDREARIFLAYGILSPLYTVLLLATIATFFGRWLTRSFGGWGFAALVVVLFAVTAAPRRGLGRLLRVWWAEKRPVRALRQRPRLAAAAVLLPLVVAFTPWTIRATTALELEPAERIFLRAPARALLAEVRVRDGGRVSRGDTIALLQDPQLSVSYARATSSVRALERRAAAARSQGDVAGATLLQTELESQGARLQQLERRLAAFALVADADGILVAPRFGERLGERFAAGDSLAQIWRAGPLRARLRLPQRDAGGVRAGSRVRVRFPATGAHTLRGSVAEVEPLAAEGIVQALVDLPTLPQTLRPGMRGRARVDLEHTTIAGALARGARRLLRLDLLL